MLAVSAFVWRIYGLLFNEFPTDDDLSSLPAALFFSDGSVREERLTRSCSIDSIVPDDTLASILEYVPTDASVHITSKRLRRLSMFPLTQKYSTLYIENEDFRNQVNAKLSYPNMQIILHLGGDIGLHYIADLHNVRAKINALLDNPRKQIRLNLGSEFREYIVNSEIRVTVNSLVENPMKQVWSDVIELILFNNTQVDDISPLAALKNLKYLMLSGTQVSDISPLARLEKLEYLHLSNTQVVDIRPLAGLNNLKELNLSFTQVTDIRPLAGLKNLKWLNLEQTQVTDITSVAGLKSLDWLNFGQT